MKVLRQIVQAGPQCRLEAAQRGHRPIGRLAVDVQPQVGRLQPAGAHRRADRVGQRRLDAQQQQVNRFQNERERPLWAMGGRRMETTPPL